MHNKSVYMVVLACLVALFFAPKTIGAAGCDTPLPKSFSVVPARDGLPAGLARFLGAWGGKWDGGFCNTLIVEDIDLRGNAKVVYAWDTQGRIWEGYSRPKAKFEGEKLRFNFPGGAAIVTYWFDGDQLKGTYVNDWGTSQVTLVRKELRPQSDGPARLSLPSGFVLDIQKPDAAVSAGNAAFAGWWSGNWDFGQLINIIVERVNPDGNVSGVYAWASGTDVRTSRFRTKIANGRMEWGGPTNRLTLAFGLDGKLHATQTWGGGQESVMTRID